MKSLATAFLLCCSVSDATETRFPAGMLGSWATKKNTTPKAIVGPLAQTFVGFTAQRDLVTGDVWFTLLHGQTFRVHGNQMQYCFGPFGHLVEQSPFEVSNVSDTAVSFCWRSGLRGMPTHKLGCSGCDCAKIDIALLDATTVSFKFWMSPPVVHADITFVRSGPAPSMLKIWETMRSPYQQCRIVDHYGPNDPPQPDLRNRTNSTPRCSSGVLEQMKATDPELHGLLEARLEAARGEESPGRGICRQMNGMNYNLNEVTKLFMPSRASIVRDVRLQYRQPSLPCSPCNVSYSISAAIPEDEYISLGFKGRSWEADMPHQPEDKRPCYFGMCMDSFDNFTSDRIALGYASSEGGCVREMIAKSVIGKPEDAKTQILSYTSVQRLNGRTVMRFTVPQHWQDGNHTRDGPFRVMWAIGKVKAGASGSSGGCDADIGYHNADRGMCPLEWMQPLYFGISPGSYPCKSNENEMGDSSETFMVI